MSKLSYQDLLVIVDPLVRSASEDLIEIYSRRSPVSKAHMHPSQGELLANPGLRSEWFGPNPTALRAREEAIAPFDAEYDARRAILEDSIREAAEAAGWTEEEFELACYLDPSRYLPKTSQVNS